MRTLGRFIGTATIFFFLIALFTPLVTSCGQTRKPVRSSVGADEDGEETTTSPKKKNKISLGEAGDDEDEPTQPSSQCSTLQNQVNQMLQACGSTFNKYASELSSTCNNAFQNLYNTQCSGLSSRVSSAVSACGSEVKQYKNYLPSSCWRILDQYM